MNPTTENEVTVAELPAGKYIVAVSGGVDSMVLLDLVRRQPQLDLIVAHIDHGMRENSAMDRRFVQDYAMSHNIPFVFETVRLGKGASEAYARTVRYKFLRHTRKKYNATQIILAHHQDDMLETALINILRGTGRRGLAALRSHDDLLRPLLHVTKASLVAHARRQGLLWREDLSNNDQSYLRNYIRQTVLKSASEENKKKLLTIIVRHSELNLAIESELGQLFTQYVHIQGHSLTLPRHPLIMWPQSVSYEFLQYCFKQHMGNTLTRALALRALLFAQTAQPHKLLDLNVEWRLRAEHRFLIVEPRGHVVSY